MRSISLTVDVTNYVMLECGQPLHAFDYRMLADHTVVVRRYAGRDNHNADGVKRTLDLRMWDRGCQVPSAVAGVMGARVADRGRLRACVAGECAL